MFYYVETVILLEDFIEKVDEADHPSFALKDTTYYNTEDITHSYRRAAL